MAKKAAQVADKPLQYLDKAMGRIRDLGLWPEKVEEQPITGLLQEITDLDETRVVLIGRTLNQASTFNDVVREQVASMNTAQLNQAWATYWDKASPQSPINLYKDGTTIRVQIRSISFLSLGSGKEVAQVRFTKFARPGGTGDDQATHWVSTIDFAYSKPSSDEKLRSLNPLGFKVVEYQREPEVATQTAPKGAQ